MNLNIFMHGKISDAAKILLLSYPLCENMHRRLHALRFPGCKLRLHTKE